MLKHFRVPGRLAVKLEELGVSVPAVLRKAGLPRDLFEQTRVLVSTGELFALWRAIDQMSADPLIGVKLGVETKTERFHPMALAALSTENLVAASQHMARYKKLTAPEEILVELDAEEFTVGFSSLGNECSAVSDQDIPMHQIVGGITDEYVVVKRLRKKLGRINHRTACGRDVSPRLVHPSSCRRRFRAARGRRPPRSRRQLGRRGSPPPPPGGRGAR